MATLLVARRSTAALLRRPGRLATLRSPFSTSAAASATTPPPFSIEQQEGTEGEEEQRAEKKPRPKRNATFVRKVPRYARAEEHAAPAGLRKCLEWSAKYPRKFDENVDLSLKLNVDPKKPLQSVRSSVVLPHASGRKPKIGVFVEDSDLDVATPLLKAAGASVVGGAELVGDVVRGDFDFDAVTAAESTLPTLTKQLARILGPKGLMPSKKRPETVAADLPGLCDNVKRLAKAPVVLKTEPKFPNLHARVGRVSLGFDKLLDNLRDLLIALQAAKPEKAPKGRLIKGASISSTMGPGIRLDVATLDANSPRFLREDS